MLRLAFGDASFFELSIAIDQILAGTKSAITPKSTTLGALGPPLASRTLTAREKFDE